MINRDAIVENFVYGQEICDFLTENRFEPLAWDTSIWPATFVGYFSIPNFNYFYCAIQAPLKAGQFGDFFYF